VKTECIEFTNNKSQRITGRIHYPDLPTTRGLVFCHGLFSSKDARKIVHMAEPITGSGCAVLTFDFSFAAMGDFSEFSILQEVEDLRRAVGYFKECGIREMHLVGSSMGGVVALLFASEGAPFLKSLTLIATPVNMEELLETMFPETNMGSLPEEGMSMVDGIPIHNRFIREALSIDLLKRLPEIRIPVLVIHGREDTVVNTSNALVANTVLRSKKNLIIIEDGDHNLTRDSDLTTLCQSIIRWIS
jgi:putative redox protein